MGHPHVRDTPIETGEFCRYPLKKSNVGENFGIPIWILLHSIYRNIKFSGSLYELSTNVHSSLSVDKDSSFPRSGCLKGSSNWWSFPPWRFIVGNPCYPDPREPTPQDDFTQWYGLVWNKNLCQCPSTRPIPWLNWPLHQPWLIKTW